uniref:3'-5' exonuclease domain-containing protein n=1 Tax=Glossina austeni TaxID=7395 RepID=A0A1A9VR75_GLOAU
MFSKIQLLKEFFEMQLLKINFYDLTPVQMAVRIGALACFIVLAVFIAKVTITLLCKMIKSYLNYLKKPKCNDMVKTLRSHCSDYNVLGFHCEWVSVKDNSRSVAMLQLCSPKAFCAVFRLCRMRRIPKSLRALLEDENIIKVGVDIVLDANKLTMDYGIKVVGAFDLRYMALMARRKPEDLDSMSVSILNVKLKKDNDFNYYWDAKELEKEEIDYAANNAYASVEIFKSLAFELDPVDLQQFPNGNLSKSLFRLNISEFLDLHFGEWRKTTVQYSTIVKSLEIYCPSEKCLLLAPDDEFVCLVDKSKGEWYLREQLGAQVDSEKFTVRIKFFPTVRAIGFYQRSNSQCYICGHPDGFLHKPVVPMDFREFFPVTYQLFTCHDIIFLCPKCLRLTDVSDIEIYNKLKGMSLARYSCDRFLKTKEAAKTLLNGQASEENSKYCKALVSDFFNSCYDTQPEINQDQLHIVLSRSVIHSNYATVKKFQIELGGLWKLEKLWRDHFWSKYCPPSYSHQAMLLWSKDCEEPYLKVQVC